MDRQRRSEEQSEEVTALSALWPPSSQSLSKSKSGFTLKQHRLHKTQSEPDITKPTKQLRPSTSGSKDRSYLDQQKVVQPKQLMRSKAPQDVDMNDFIVKAAASQVVVDPALVKKKGNIDDEIADPVKTKARLKQVEDEMKSVNATIEDDKKDVKKDAQPGIKWGDAKCVVYETRDQVTLEDDIDDAADVY
ncbi:hypothetical protein OSTOST_17781 [Ostertagia ostertagi]